MLKSGSKEASDIRGRFNESFYRLLFWTCLYLCSSTEQSAWDCGIKPPRESFPHPLFTIYEICDGERVSKYSHNLTASEGQGATLFASSVMVSGMVCDVFSGARKCSHTGTGNTETPGGKWTEVRIEPRSCRTTLPTVPPKTKVVAEAFNQPVFL